MQIHHLFQSGSLINLFWELYLQIKTTTDREQPIDIERDAPCMLNWLRSSWLRWRSSRIIKRILFSVDVLERKYGPGKWVRRASSIADARSHQNLIRRRTGSWAGGHQLISFLFDHYVINLATPLATLHCTAAATIKRLARPLRRLSLLK